MYYDSCVLKQTVQYKNNSNNKNDNNNNNDNNYNNNDTFEFLPLLKLFQQFREGSLSESPGRIANFRQHFELMIGYIEKNKLKN